MKVCDCTAKVKWREIRKDITTPHAIEMVGDADSCPVCRMYPWYEEEPTLEQQDQWTRAMNELKADATLQ